MMNTMNILSQGKKMMRKMMMKNETSFFTSLDTTAAGGRETSPRFNSRLRLVGRSFFLARSLSLRSNEFPFPVIS